MAKNIVFCADGTWNGPQARHPGSLLDVEDADGGGGRDDITNVLKLYSRLQGEATELSTRLSNEQERILVDGSGNVAQVAKYIHGVGDSSNLLLKALGGTLGLGIITRIVRGYTFISRWYDPGDAIHIVGFSRGAYTARALSGMIAKVGLLNRAVYDPANENEAYRLGILAWSRARTASLTGTGRLVGLANHILGVTQGFFGDTLPKNALIPDVPIKSVAVWDTVGSLGIPKYAGDQRYDVFRFTDSALSQKVEFGFHAMAVDEQRRDFPVTRWDDRKGVTQIWFVGAHSDVGGGNKKDQSALSDVALDWMISKLGRIGVRFVERAQDMPGAPEGFPAYQTPWKDFPFDTLGTSVRDVLANDRVHVTLPKRWDGAAPPYRPESMQRFREPGLGGLGTDE